MLGTLQTLVLTLIVCAVLEAVVPPGKGRHAFQMLCAVVIFSALLSGAKIFDVSSFDPDALLSQTQDVSVRMEAENDAALLLAAEAGYESAVKETLENAGVAFAGIKATCEIREDGAVLERLRVSGVAAEQRDAADQTLSALLKDTRARIIITEESQ